VTSDALELARTLIAIDSVNPLLVPGAAGEGEIARFCAGWLAERGFEVTILEQSAGRPSVVGVLRGSGGGRTLMLNGHLDTVSATPSQLTPTVRDGNLYGRGAFDMKTGVAAIMVAADAARGLRGDVLVTLVADEEFGSAGTEEVLAAFSADGAIVAEPSGFELTVAHRGFAWFDVQITGKAAHGSMPEQGIDAISHAGRVMRALDVLEGELKGGAGHPLLAPATVRVATIAGGVDAATVAPSCTLTIERRYLPGETPAAVEEQLRDVIHRVPGDATTTVTALVSRAAFEADPGGDVVNCVSRAYEAVVGAPVVQRGEPFWTDAALIAQAGIPCIIIGVDGGGAHADKEWATTRSIDRLTAVLEKAIREFCS